MAILEGQKRIKLKVIRPQRPLEVDIQNFDKEDIQRMILLGYQHGRDEMMTELNNG